jgi:hypothetical protein
MVAKLKVYDAEVDRDGSVWRVRVPQVARSTQARALSEVDAMARDLIAIMEDVPQDSFRLNVIITLPPDVQVEVDLSTMLRHEAARQQKDAAHAARRAALRLRQHGLSLKDVGQALGVSHQRAKQLIDEAEKLAS